MRPSSRGSSPGDGNGGDEAMFRRFNRKHSRFDQPDPYDGSYNMADPQSFNRYAYVQNDPVNFVDPSGLDDYFIPAWQNGWDRFANPIGNFLNGAMRDLVADHNWFVREEEGGVEFDGFGPITFGQRGRSGGSRIQDRRFGRKDKEDRCKEAINEAARAISEIDRRMGNAISAPGGLDAGHQKAIAQDIGRLKSALEAIDKNCFDGPGGPPLLPELADSLNKLRQNASEKMRIPPVGWDGGRSAAEHRIKAVAFGANVGSALLRVIQWLRHAVAF